MASGATARPDAYNDDHRPLRGPTAKEKRGSGFYLNHTYDLRLLCGENGGWHGFPDLAAGT